MTSASPLAIPTRIFRVKVPFGDLKGRSSSILLSNSMPARTADSVEFSFPVNNATTPSPSISIIDHL